MMLLLNPLTTPSKCLTLLFLMGLIVMILAYLFSCDECFDVVMELLKLMASEQFDAVQQPTAMAETDPPIPLEVDLSEFEKCIHELAVLCISKKTIVVYHQHCESSTL